MNQIPVKFRVVETIYQNGQMSNREILEILKNEYPFDRGINEKGVEEYLLSLKAVGIIELADASMEHDEKLKMYYKITGYGASRMKYITCKTI